MVARGLHREAFWFRRRACVAAAAAGCLAAAILATLAAPAAASTLLTNVQSETCLNTAAQTWRIGYRLYFADTSGRTTDRAAIPEVESQAQGFANTVGTDSACALRASIDIYDMNAEPWTGTAGNLSLTPPADNQSFRAAGAYDAVFMRYPRQGPEEFSGISAVEYVNDAQGKTQGPYPYAAFPVDAQGRTFPEEEPPRGPWRLLLMHEWMHGVVAFYEPAELGWPHNDVHGATEHGYVFPGVGSGVVEPYFTDMLQGRVPENGQLKGLLPQDYLVEGTPAHAKRSYLDLETRIDATGHVHYSAPADFDGTLTFTVQNGSETPNPNPIVRDGKVAGPGASWTLDDRGLPKFVTACASSASTGSTRYRPYSACFQLFVPRCVVPKLVGLSVRAARSKLRLARCRLGAVKRIPGKGKIRVRAQSTRKGRHLKPRATVRIVVGPPPRHR